MAYFFCCARPILSAGCSGLKVLWSEVAARVRKFSVEQDFDPHVGSRLAGPLFLLALSGALDIDSRDV